MPEFEVVFAEGRQDRVAVAKSALTSAGIEFVVYGEGVQDLFGWGRFPLGTNVFIGPVEIRVAREQAADARALLEGRWETELSDASEVLDEDECAGDGVLWRWARPIARLAAAVALAIAVLGLLSGILSLLSAF